MPYAHEVSRRGTEDGLVKMGKAPSSGRCGGDIFDDLCAPCLKPIRCTFSVCCPPVGASTVKLQWIHACLEHALQAHFDGCRYWLYLQYEVRLHDVAYPPVVNHPVPWPTCRHTERLVYSLSTLLAGLHICLHMVLRIYDGNEYRICTTFTMENDG